MHRVGVHPCVRLSVPSTDGWKAINICLCQRRSAANLFHCDLRDDLLNTLIHFSHLVWGQLGLIYSEYYCVLKGIISFMHILKRVTYQVPVRLSDSIYMPFDRFSSF